MKDEIMLDQTIPLILIISSIFLSSLSAKRYPYRNADSQYYDQRNSVYNRPSHSSSYSSFSGFSGLLPAVQCYSCMSESYEPYWHDMKEVYRKQDVMTNRCNEPFFSRGIPPVNCSNICVTMKETIHIAGIKAVTAYIRGCLDKILVNGHRFNETALITYNFYRKDHCRELSRSMLISPSMTGTVVFCSCYGNRCNKGTRLRVQYMEWFNMIGWINPIDWTICTPTVLWNDEVHAWLVMISSSLLHLAVLSVISRILI